MLSILQGSNIHPQIHSPPESLCEEALEGEGAVKVHLVLEPVTCPPEGTWSSCSLSPVKGEIWEIRVETLSCEGQTKGCTNVGGL